MGGLGLRVTPRQSALVSTQDRTVSRWGQLGGSGPGRAKWVGEQDAGTC